MFKVNNKDTRTTPLACNLFEPVIADWVGDAFSFLGTLKSL